jgi:hypothetical protein
MELKAARESVLHFFEQVRKRYPSMRNFYGREHNEHVLEENKELGHYRWAAVEKKRLSAGYVNPDSIDDAIGLHRLVLELAPYALSVSDLDCESINLMYGFDFTYRGNHNQLIADVLGIVPAFDGFGSMPGVNPIAYEPSIQVAMDEDCRLQCRLSIETRSSAYHVRTGSYPEEQLSVYVTARQYGSLEAGETFVSVLQKLNEICLEVVDSHVLDQVLRPLQQTISLR